MSDYNIFLRVRVRAHVTAQRLEHTTSEHPVEASRCDRLPSNKRSLKKYTKQEKKLEQIHVLLTHWKKKGTYLRSWVLAARCSTMFSVSSLSGQKERSTHIQNSRQRQQQKLKQACARLVEIKTTVSSYPSLRGRKQRQNSFNPVLRWLFHSSCPRYRHLRRDDRHYPPYFRAC